MDINTILIQAVDVFVGIVLELRGAFEGSSPPKEQEKIASRRSEYDLLAAATGGRISVSSFRRAPWLRLSV